MSLGRGTFLLAIGTVLLLGLNFVGRVLVARSLPVQDWGEFNLGLAVTGLVAIVALLGMAQAVARSLSYHTHPGERRAIVRWSLSISTGLATVSSIGLYVFSLPLAQAFHNLALVPVFQLLSVTAGFTILSSILAALFQGFEDVRPNVWFNLILDPALFVVFLAAFLLLHLGLTGVLLAYVACNAVALVGLIWYALEKLPGLLPPTSEVRKPPPELWDLTLAFWGVNSFSFLTAFSDTLILGLFWPVKIVGYYSAAMTLARLLILGSQALTFIFLPLAARLHRTGELSMLRGNYVLGTRWTVLLTLPLFLLFFATPTFAMTAIFGAKYDAGSISLAFLSLTAFAAGLLGPVNAALAGFGQARNQLMTASTSGVVNIALSLALIPSYGLLGATVAWGVARALFPALGLVLLYRGYGLTPFRRPLLLPTGIALAIGLPLFYLVGLTHPAHWVVVPMVLAGAGLFIGAVLATKTLLPGDLIFVQAAERVLRTKLPALRRFLATRMVPLTSTA